MPCNGPTNSTDPNNGLTVIDGYTELPTLWREMVPMVSADKLYCLTI